MYRRDFEEFIDELLNDLKVTIDEKATPDKPVGEVKKEDNTIKVILPGVKQVEVYYLPNERAVEVEVGDSLIPRYSNTTMKIKLPSNKKPASAKLDSGVLVIELKDDIKSEKVEVEVL